MRIIKRAIHNILRKKSMHYTQGDEGKTIDEVFKSQSTGFYIDVGAHDPVRLSNTFGLYQKGWRGLCLEPNPALHSRFRSIRPEDTLIAAAAGSYDGIAAFYVRRYSVHSSLRLSKHPHVKKIGVSVRRLDSLLKELRIDKEIDMISIDTEGTELDVLEGLNLSENRPRLIVVEYNTNGQINTSVQPYLIGQGYQVLAMTCWNIIATDRLEEDYAVLIPDRRRLRSERRTGIWPDLDRFKASKLIKNAFKLI